MKQFLRKFKSDNSGVMTMEFMVMLPILLMWFAGTFVFFDAFYKWMKAMKASYTVSDMLSRQVEIDDDYLFAMDNIFDRLAHSRNPEESWFRVTHVQYSNNALLLHWSTETKDRTSVDGDPGEAFQLEDVAKHIPTLVNGEYITLLETNAPFNPLFDWVGLSSTTFYNVIAAPQRFKSELVNDDHPDGSVSSFDGYDPDELDADDDGEPDPNI